MYLAAVPVKKEERVLVIGGFGEFTFMIVAYLQAIPTGGLVYNNGGGDK